MVGNPFTPTSSHKDLPAAVQSTSAIRIVEWFLYSAVSLSRSGFILLQCPHHGAKNFTKTVLPAVLASHVAEVSSFSPGAAARNPGNPTVYAQAKPPKSTAPAIPPAETASHRGMPFVCGGSFGALCGF